MSRSSASPFPLNLHLHQLAHLREVQRQGSLTEAAAALHLSQPALSQSLREIERRLGQPVYEREGRTRRLTAAGEELLAFAEEVLGRAEGLMQGLEARRQGERGRLRVGMIDAASLYVLPGVVRRYRRERTEVELVLTVAPSEQLLAALSRYELDLAFAVGPVHDPKLEAVEVRREALQVYAPPDSAGHDLAAAEWILYPPGSRTRALIDQAFIERGVRPRVTLETGSPEVMRQLVSLGLGWSVLPEAVAQGAVTELRRVRGRALTQRSLMAFRRASAPTDPLVEDFLSRALAG
jgi:DNA-binding transcriptional LysR family regulator